MLRELTGRAVGRMNNTHIRIVNYDPYKQCTLRIKAYTLTAKLAKLIGRDHRFKLKGPRSFRLL